MSVCTACILGIGVRTALLAFTQFNGVTEGSNFPTFTVQIYMCLSLNLSFLTKLLLLNRPLPMPLNKIDIHGLFSSSFSLAEDPPPYSTGPPPPHVTGPPPPPPHYAGPPPPQSATTTTVVTQPAIAVHQQVYSSYILLAQ